MSRSDVVRRLRALATRGVPISVRYLLPVHAELVGQALAIFGSFDRARAIAGLASPPLEHDPDVIIGALRSLAKSGVRLDVATLSTMGESGLVAASVDTFGSLAVAAARAGVGVAPPPEMRRQSYERERERGQPMGFNQPPMTQDGQVSTALALEMLQKTALQLGRVPAARDLPPDVARRLTTDYGSVRFAYLALRVHAEGEGAQRTAETAAQAASEPVQLVTQEALEATARLLESVGVHRRNVEEAHAAQQEAAPPPIELESSELDDVWADVERAIDEAAVYMGEVLKEKIGEALERFVDEVTEMARHATLAALLPGRSDAAPEPEAEVEGEAEAERAREEE
jgi:hypothetical protein